MQELPSLTEADIDALYAQHVRPQVFGHVRPSPTPVVVFVGAQPAAGKTGVVATSIHRSRLAAQTRYLDPIEAGRPEQTRWTPRGALDRGYEESAKILTAARGFDACHTISVYNRDGERLASIARDAEGQWPVEGDDPETVCREYRETSAPPREDYLRDLDTIETRAARLNVITAEVQTTFAELRAAADGLRSA